MMCVATCWTDHKLVRAKLRIDLDCRRPPLIAVWKFADSSICDHEDYLRGVSDWLEGVDPVVFVGWRPAGTKFRIV